MRRTKNNLNLQGGSWKNEKGAGEGLVAEVHRGSRDTDRDTGTSFPEVLIMSHVRQHAWHAERARYCFTISLCPSVSVRRVVLLYLNEFTNVKLFGPSGRSNHHIVSLNSTTVTKFQRQPPQWGVKYTG